MSNPWLREPKPDRALPPEELKDRIAQLLSSQNMAVVATVAADGSPAATPIRYYSLGFEVMYTSWNASPKSRNLRRDPRVSVGIFAPYVGLASSRGAQLLALLARWSVMKLVRRRTGGRSAGSRTTSRLGGPWRSLRAIR